MPKKAPERIYAYFDDQIGDIHEGATVVAFEAKEDAPHSVEYVRADVARKMSESNSLLARYEDIGGYLE